jgi:hypothetical protein
MSNVLKPVVADTLKPDPFWDGKSGGGIRCSSDGQAGNYYHDASAVGGFEAHALSGRSMASLLPGLGYGLRGVVVPRATWWGGSRGFDPHKPRLMNIDPDIDGQASVVDVSQFSKEVVAQAYELAWQQVGEYGDPRLVAAQAYRNMAVGTEPVGMKAQGNNGYDERLAPLGGLDTYVVPKAAPGGGQIMPMRPIRQNGMSDDVPVSPSVAPGPPPKPDMDPDSVLAFNRPDDPNKMTKAQYRQAARESSQALMDKLGVQRARGNWTEEEQQQVVVLREQVDNRRGQMPQTRMEEPVFQDQQQPRQTQEALQTTQLPPKQLIGAPRPNLAPPVASGFNDQTPFPVRPFPQPFQQHNQSLPAIPDQAGPPTTEVIFEIEGWGQIPLAYHKVIRNGMLLVLGWDKRWTTGKSFPPAAEKVMAAHVRGTDKVFYVHSTGSTFEDSNMEYCILLIAKEVNPNQG